MQSSSSGRESGASTRVATGDPGEVDITVSGTFDGRKQWRSFDGADIWYQVVNGKLVPGRSIRRKEKT